MGLPMHLPPTFHTIAAKLTCVMRCTNRDIANVEIAIIQTMWHCYSISEMKKIVITHLDHFLRVKFSFAI